MLPPKVKYKTIRKSLLIFQCLFRQYVSSVYDTNVIIESEFSIRKTQGICLDLLSWIYAKTFIDYLKGV